jgi:hypothetical protein
VFTHGILDVHPSQKLVALVLAEHALKGSALAWPSVETIARLSCLKRRQVQTILRELVRDGLVEVEKASVGGRLGDGSAGDRFPVYFSRLYAEKMRATA